MGEVIPFRGRGHRPKKADIPKQPSSQIEPVRLAQTYSPMLVHMTEAALLKNRGKFSFNQRFLPILNYGYVENRQRRNFIGIVPSSKQDHINVAVTDYFSLGGIKLDKLDAELGPGSAEALYMVAYGIATHAAGKSARVQAKGFDETLWNRTDTSVPKVALPFRAAAMVVSQYFKVNEVQLNQQDDLETIVPSHLASLHNPLNELQARELYSILA